MSASRLFVLSPCAGSGSRAGSAGPKQYRRIAGRPMVEHTLEAFRALAGTFAGLAPLLVPGSAQNFKLTYAEDFALADAILRSRRSMP